MEKVKKKTKRELEMKTKMTTKKMRRVRKKSKMAEIESAGRWVYPV
jgi:hypothetical protein